MRAPVLCAVVVISLGLAGVLEFLAQKSQRQGGLALSSSEDDISESVNIAYLYMPTTVAVLYSLLWTWIDLDVRRMQPWFELSRPHGANAEQSLLLNYPFEFLAFVPFKAWKQRHWLVFITGSVMMLIFWAITPLQGAIFGQQAVTVSTSSVMGPGSGLVAVEEQAALIDVSILNSAYGTTWYNRDLPEYTTTEYAVLPFSPLSQSTLGVNETWTANTTKFATDLNCWPAKFTENIKAVQGGQYLFDNGEGCLQNITISGGKEGRYIMQYIGYKGDAHLDWHLASSECGPEFSHQFLAIAGRGSGTGANATIGNMTAMFCEPSYTKQPVSITVDAVTRRPLNDSLVELAPPSPLNNTLFNISAFEFLLHAGFSSLAIPRDYPNNLILDQYAKLYDSNISWPTTNMVGFAVGLHDGSLADFLNTAVVQESYAAAHKLAFSLAISQLASRTADPETHSGVIEYAAFGVVVSRPFSVAVEILLVVVAFSTVVLLYAIVRSPSNLTSDPDSIASLFGFIQKEDAVLSHLSTKDNLTEASLIASIRADRYHLTPTNDTTGPTLQLLSSGNGPGTSLPNSIPTLVSRTQTQSIRPKELRPTIGAPFVLILAFAIGILAYLKHQEMSLHGLTRPSQNFEVLQLLENYIPMVFSTLLEPFLVVLNRLLCLLQPYYDLLDGKRSPKTTIETKYDSLPPQLVVWRAVKAGHYFLAILSVVVLMANVLAIGLGAIFNESSTSVLATRNVTSLVSPSLSRVDLLPESFATGKGTQYYDHFYIVQTNMSADTRLPPWIDAQFTYLPFSDLTSSDNSSAQYTAVTRGFGTEATCSMLPTDNSSLNRLEYSYNTTAGPATQQLIKAVYEDTPYGNTTKCMLPGFIDDAIGGILPEGKSAHEFYSALEQEDVNTFKNASEEAVAFCEERIVLGWMRYDTSEAESGPDMTFLQCTTHLVTAQFSITVDPDGYILRSERLGDYDNITEILGPSAANISHQANLLIGDKWHSSSTGAKYMWHNDSVTTDWMNYYLKIATNGTDLIDPNKPLPDAVRLIPIVQEMYQRIGAALLGANRDLFVDSPQDQGSVLLATIETQDTKIFMDNTALIISLTILGIYLLVSILLYARQRRILLPRMPSTIGSTVAYAAGSRAVRLYNGPGKDGSARETYNFGRYLGIDGKAHIGIELDPYVFPLDQTSSLGGSKERLKNRV